MKIRIVMLLLFATQIAAQNIDSLFNEYLVIKGVKEATELPDKPGHDGHNHLKCGTGTIMEIKENLHRLSPEQLNTFNSVTGRPQNQTSKLTPKGYVRVHYDVNNDNFSELGYDLDLLMEAIDSVYNYEVNILGYPAPPSDNGKGGGNELDIYVMGLSSGLYGYTETEDPLSQNRMTTFCVIDNDYSNYYTKGIDGARVTVAHEFHHAIQIGAYVNNYSIDRFYYELTATSMEEFVYDDINDYYDYLHTYFRNPDQPMPEFQGYSLGIWNVFLEKRLGHEVIKLTWEYMDDGHRALKAMDRAIQDFGSTFQIEFTEFAKWNYYTGSKKLPGQYFEEGAEYPEIAIMSQVNFISNKASVMLNTKPVSTTYIEFFFPGIASPFPTALTNNDINNGVNNTNQITSVEYSIFDSQVSGSFDLGNGYYSKVESDNLSLIGEFTNSEKPTVVEAFDFAFPQPYYYSVSGNLSLPVPDGNDNFADIFIYSGSMVLIFEGRLSVTEHIRNDNSRYTTWKVVKWDGLDNDGNMLPSGIYIYVTKMGDEIKKGKLAIFND